MIFSLFSLAHTYTVKSLLHMHTFSFTGTSTLARPLSHTYVQTEPLSVLLPFPISFSFIPTHTVILAFLSPLSLSLTHTVCFLVSHKLGGSHFLSTCTHRAGYTPCLMPIPRTPSVPPAPTRGSPGRRASTVSEGFSVTHEAEQPGRVCPLCHLTSRPLSPPTGDRACRQTRTPAALCLGSHQHISDFL